MEKETLFQEFPDISTDAWKQQIIKDLKGDDYDRKLVWKTAEGFDVQPFYRNEDLEHLTHTQILPGNFPYLRGHKIKDNRWLIRQDLKVMDIGQANKKAIRILGRGVDSLGFVFEKGRAPSVDEMEQFLQNIPVGQVELNFLCDRPKEILNALKVLSEKHHQNPSQWKGSVNYDPLGGLTLNGRFDASEEASLRILGALHTAATPCPGVHFITVSADLFHNSGAGTVSEMAFSLAMATEYLAWFSENGFDMDQAAAGIRFHYAVGGNYFMEVAKFRALRYLWARIVAAFGVSDVSKTQMFVHCTNSSWNKTRYDPYVNLLRTTTETMSALMGGIDSMTVLPFNAVFEDTNEISERIARNQQLVLKGEAHFNEVIDPAAGSYYVENLTDQLIRGAWKLFLEVDEKGGYIKAFKQGFIQAYVKKEADIKNGQIALRRKSILGTNQYPNITEHLTPSGAAVVPESDEGEAPFERLMPYRASADFERLRLQTDLYAMDHPRPKVWMLTYGNLAMRKARSQFAGNFFGCAGFEIIDNPGFTTIEEGIEAAIKAQPDLVVICSSDDEYADIALPIYESLKSNFVVVLAGYPTDLVEGFKAKGLTNFIHLKTNVLEELKRYQTALGVC